MGRRVPTTVLTSSYDKSFVTPYENLQKHSLADALGLKAPVYDITWAEDGEEVIFSYHCLRQSSSSHSPSHGIRPIKIPTRIYLLHTPGHTPGSQCFLVEGRLVSGDTLFLDGCGRTDLPGSDSDAMYESLQRLAQLPADTIVYPGHRYSLPCSGTMEKVREINSVYRPKNKDSWLMMFGQG